MSRTARIDPSVAPTRSNSSRRRARPCVTSTTRSPARLAEITTIEQPHRRRFTPRIVARFERATTAARVHRRAWCRDDERHTETSVLISIRACDRLQQHLAVIGVTTTRALDRGRGALDKRPTCASTSGSRGRTVEQGVAELRQPSCTVFGEWGRQVTHRRTGVLGNPRASQREIPTWSSDRDRRSHPRRRTPRALVVPTDASRSSENRSSLRRGRHAAPSRTRIVAPRARAA